MTNNIQFVPGSTLAISPAINTTGLSAFGFNNTNPQYTVDVSGSINASSNIITSVGIINAGTYINPPLILTGAQTGIATNYSYVVNSGGVNTGYFQNATMVAGQELQISNKGGTFTVTGTVTGGYLFFNTGTITSGFTIPSGTTRFFFADGTHFVVQ